ncbi:MAG: hypothetical protein WCJ29_06280 [bacterium]
MFFKLIGSDLWELEKLVGAVRTVLHEHRAMRTYEAAALASQIGAVDALTKRLRRWIESAKPLPHGIMVAGFQYSTHPAAFVTHEDALKIGLLESIAQKLRDGMAISDETLDEAERILEYVLVPKRCPTCRGC